MLREKTKRITVSCILVVAMLVSGIATSFAEETKEAADKPKDAKEAAFEIASEAGAVYCENTGEFIYKKNINRKLSPYSITKVFTALLAVQKLSLDQEVTISQAAASQEGSLVGLKEGEVVTVKDLLYGNFIVSGNDAAYALGEAVSGDMDSFVALMNETLANMGCKNTKFVSPSGMINDVNEHYTTVKDMTEITQAAFRNKTVREIAGATEYKMPKTNMSEERLLEGHNELLKKKEFVAGKTGYWDDANCTIVMEYEKKGLHFLIVLLGSNAETRNEDCVSMCKKAEKKVNGIKVISAGENAGKVRVKHGAQTSIKACAAEDGFAYLPKAGSKSLISSKVVMNDDVEAPLKKGDVVGVYKVYVGDEIVNEIDLVAKQNVETGWILSYLGISNKATAVIVLVLVLLIALLIVRSVNKARSRRRKKAAKKAKAMKIAQQLMEQEEYERRRGWHR